MNNGKTLEVFYAEDKRTERMLFEIAVDAIALPAVVKMAKNCKEVMNMLSCDTYRPDVIFVDMAFPTTKDGTDCLDAIRKIEKLKETPVVVFSNICNEEVIKMAYHHRANLFVQKPFNVTQQTELMKKLFALNWDDYLPQPDHEKFVFEVNFLKNQ